MSFDLGSFPIADKLALALGGVVAWVGKQHLNHDKEVAEQLRIEATHLESRLETRLNLISAQIGENHNALLAAITSQSRE